ncbi:MAG: hypothetical protein FWC79_06130 [Oscillospiraceae bacterium]|nr:hypothetical protein [Oscillospiraceae bacterium]
MNQKKIIKLILITILMVGAIIAILAFLQKNESEPFNDYVVSPHFFVALDGIEELNTIRELFEQGRYSESVIFFQQAGRGESDIRNKREVERFLNIFDSLTLPTNSSWNSLTFSMNSGPLILRYENIYDEAEIAFLIDYTPSGSFERMIEEFYDTYIFNDVTDRILEVAQIPIPQTEYLRVGSDIKIFEVYPQNSESRFIVETEYGVEVGVVLYVDGEAISAVVHNASSLEVAFKILADVEFTQGIPETRGQTRESRRDDYECLAEMFPMVELSFRKTSTFYFESREGQAVHGMRPGETSTHVDTYDSYGTTYVLNEGAALALRDFGNITFLHENSPPPWEDDVIVTILEIQSDRVIVSIKKMVQHIAINEADSYEEWIERIEEVMLGDELEINTPNITREEEVFEPIRREVNWILIFE